MESMVMTNPEYFMSVNALPTPVDLETYFPTKTVLNVNAHPTPVILDIETYFPTKGLLTRYGKKILEEGKRFYGKIKLDELACDKKMLKNKEKTIRSIFDPWEISQISS